MFVNSEVDDTELDIHEVIECGQEIRIMRATNNHCRNLRTASATIVQIRNLAFSPGSTWGTRQRAGPA